jgi:hypothetical protein
MCGLIDPHRPAAWQRDTRDQSPPFAAHIRARDVSFGHLRDERLHVIAHQKQLVSAVGLRRMDGQLGRWQGEDQPTMPGIYGRVAEHIPEERAIGIGIGAVEHYVRASDHLLTIVGPELMSGVIGVDRARKPPERVAPVLGPHVATIRGWLTADLDAPRKQRHTARRVWQRLMEEEGVVVAESSVRALVAGLRVEVGGGRAQVMVPQTHPSSGRRYVRGVAAGPVL